MRFGSNRDGFAEPLLDVAVHRLAQLRIDLVCNRHHTDRPLYLPDFNEPSFAGLGSESLSKREQTEEFLW
jgi:hypothetical protein